LKAAMIEALVRCCVFGLLGPLAGLLALIALSRASIDFTSDGFVIVLLFTYLFGLLPALITAAFDSWANGRGAKGLLKYLLTSAFGYAAAYTFGLLTPLLIYNPRWGLIGAVPAAICSWITDKLINPVRESRRA
jgi:hypothetical protein